MKKLLSIVLTIFMLLSALPLTFSVNAADGDVISIATYDDLKAKAAAEETYEGKTLVLSADITLGADWVPFKTFKGTFDGGNKTITVSTAANKLFDKLENATVQNLNIAGSVELKFTTNNTTWGFLTGAAVGTLTVTNCHNKASANNSLVDGNGAVMNGWIACGAFVGDSNKAAITFTNCSNEGNITSLTKNNGYAGGFIGRSLGGAVFTNCKNKGDITANICGGGFIAQSNTTSVSFVNSSNEGKVIGGQYAGGFVGDLRKDSSFTNCQNTADVLSNALPSATTMTGAGGFAGRVDGNAPLHKIVNCVNSGNVSCEMASANTGYNGCAGGLFGWFQAKIEVDGFWNTGVISGAYAAGGLLGGYAQYMDNAVSKIENCIFAGDVKSVQGKDAKLLGAVLGFFGSAKSGCTTTIDNCYIVSETLAAIGGVTVWANVTKGSGTVVKLGATELKQSATMAEFVTAIETEWIKTAKKADFSTAQKALVAQKLTESRTLAISYEGVQCRASTNGFMDVRFIASLKSIEYANLGYEIVRFDSAFLPGSIKTESKTVYRSINALGADGVQTTYTAEQFNGEYLAALTLTNVPTDRDVTFVIRPYVTDKVSGEPIYGTSFTVSFHNGTLQAQY